MNEEVIEHCKRIALDTLRRSILKPKRQRLRSGGETGNEYMYRVMNTHPELCHEQLRLSNEQLAHLVDILKSRGYLTDNKFITVTEQVGMCLYVLAKGASYRDVADTFKHSLSTISFYLPKVLLALKKLSFDIIRPHTPFEEVPQKILKSSLYSPFFKDCIGALDGTHIEARISDDKGNQHRGRKGIKTWNVLACCSFDMLFTYVHVGWEGSAHDQTVWIDAITQPQFCFPHPPEGKYYLVDSGYPNTIGYLAPYKEKRVRYHMPTFRHGDRPTGVYEKFNYRHSSLRTTIERTFGILKRSWKILKVMPQVLEERQNDIITATCTLHNFIRMHKFSIPVLSNREVQGSADANLFDQLRKEQMNQVRNMIAFQIIAAFPDNVEEMNMDEDEDDNM
ncbi:unnamed protein product [Rhodiola kirilowii]